MSAATRTSKVGLWGLVVVLAPAACASEGATPGAAPPPTAATTAAVTAAAAGVLEGSVHGGTTALSGATVEALRAGTSTVAGFTTTNVDGGYQLALGAGTFDVRLTAAGDARFPPQLVRGVLLPAEGAIHDFVLLPPAATVTGVVRGAASAPVAGANLTFDDLVTFEVLGSATTDASGAYTATLTAGDYVVVVDGTGPSPAAPSGIWSITRPLAVAGATVADFTLPAVQVSGTVTDGAGAPVADAAVDASASEFNELVSQAASGTGITDAGGRYTLTLFGGTGRAVVRPPRGALVGARVEELLTVAGDTTFDAVLPAASRLTGTLRAGAGGAPVPGVTVTATLNGVDVVARAETDAAGAYQLAVADGSYGLFAAASVRLPGLPETWSFGRDQISVAGDTTFDLELPVIHVRGAVTDAAGGAGLAGVAVEAHGVFSTSALFEHSSDTATTAADGRYDLTLFAGNTSIAYSPPAGSGLVARGFGGRQLFEDADIDIALGAGVRIAGTVSLAGGAPLPGASVSAFDVDFSQFVARGVTDGAGAYTLAVAGGRYTMIVEAGSAAVTGAPAAWEISQNGVETAGAAETTVDFTLPTARLTGRAADSTGAPVPGVLLEASAGMPSNLGFIIASGTAATGADGRYSLVLVPDLARLTIHPPAGLAFALTALANLPLTGDRALDLVFVTPVPPAGVDAALEALADAVDDLPRPFARTVGAVVDRVQATADAGERALAAGNTRAARLAFCLARAELDALALVLDALPPRLVPRAAGREAAARAREASARIAARMGDAGLRACR